MSEVSITERQWERLMEVLWSIDNGIAEMNKNLAADIVTEAPSMTPKHAEPRFTPAQRQMLRDFNTKDNRMLMEFFAQGAYNLEYPGDFVEKPREHGENAGQG